MSISDEIRRPLNVEQSLKHWSQDGEFVLMAVANLDQVLREARGTTFTDVDGNQFIDLEAGQICSIVGHNHPRLVARIVEQTQAILHHGTAFMSQPIFEASKALARVTPGALKKSLIVSTGAEANECAFRIAKECTGRPGIVGFDRGYSGLTLATMNASISSGNASIAVPGTMKMLTPDCAHCPVAATFPACDFQCLKASERVLDAHCRNGVAAFVFEPILSAGGMIFPPPGYFRRLAELARRLGALLISDEAQTGMGRTGQWFGVQADGIEPDILVVSKGVGGGFPAAAVVVTDPVAEAVLGEYANYSSHQSDPVAAVAIAAVISIIEEEGLLAAATRQGEKLLQGFAAVAAKHGVIGNVRGRGLMLGFDAMAQEARGWSAEQTGITFELLCRRAGVHMRSIHSGAIFRILPALTISDAEVQTVLDVFDAVGAEIAAGRVDRLLDDTQNGHSRRVLDARTGRLTARRSMKLAWESSPADWYRRVKRALGAP